MRLTIAVLIFLPAVYAGCDPCRYFIETKTFLNAAECNTHGTYTYEIWAHDCGCSVTGTHPENFLCTCYAPWSGTSCTVHPCLSPIPVVEPVQLLEYGVDGTTMQAGRPIFQLTSEDIDRIDLPTQSYFSAKFASTDEEKQYFDQQWDFQDVTVGGMVTKFSDFLFGNHPQRVKLVSMVDESTFVVADTVELFSVIGPVHPVLDPDFEADLASMSTSRDADDLVINYGTHYYGRVYFGGTAFSTVFDCDRLVYEAGDLISSTTIVGETFLVQGGKSTSECYTASREMWRESVAGAPFPLSGNLIALSTLLTDDDQVALLDDAIVRFHNNKLSSLPASEQKSACPASDYWEMPGGYSLASAHSPNIRLLVGGILSVLVVLNAGKLYSF